MTDLDHSARPDQVSHGRHAKPEPLVAGQPGPQAPSIEIHAVTDLSYPMAHCRIPVVDHIAVDNLGDELRGAVLHLEVRSANGSHGGPKEIHLDLAAHAPTLLRDVALLLDPASMLAVDEPRPGTIRAVLRDVHGTVRAEAEKDVTILAGNQWKARPLQLGLEMLAAHVQPNAAVVTSLMLAVSDRLQALTGSSSLNGYQSDDPARVDAIAQAVFEAMRDHDIRYAEPPASWGMVGQKVRTPAEVLEGRLGTCLDTTLVMAAVLEQAGINSTIWMIKGHAFLGYWRVDSALPDVSTTEAVDVVNLVDLDQIRLVETTLITGGEQAGDFRAATAIPRAEHLSSDLSNILGITDIRRARAARIYPLPSRVTDLAGNITVIEYQPPVGPTIARYERSETVQQAPKDPVPERVRQWKNALLDLSLRNRLINYTERAGFNLAVPGSVLARFEDDINAGARIAVLASDEVSSVDAARGVRYGRDLPEDERAVLLADKRSTYLDVTAAAYKTRLRNLAYKAKTITQETGANNLYLAFGMLNWRFGDRELRSPVVLVPVNLSTTNRGDRYVLSIDEAGVSTPNYCLIEKLRLSFGLEIPELANPAEDASGIDLAGTFDAVRRAIAAAGLPFRVEDSVALAILQFAKFPLWKDLDESWEQLADNSLVRHLIDTPLAAYTDPVPAPDGVDLNDLRPHMPVPADSSQLQAIAEAVGGRTFVLEGPPGTGKSQTITNLLAHAMASGRRVLFVAEKKAALDVVKKRLDAVGLGELSLNLHDKSARPAAVREQIKTALELRVTADSERLRTNQQIAAAARTTLSRYAERLHAENAAGLSAYTARSKELAADQDVAALDVPRELVAAASTATMAQIGELLRALPAVAELARPSADHPWGFLDAVPADTAGTYRAAVEFDAALAGLLDDGQRRGIGLAQLDRVGAPAALGGWARLAGAPRYPLAGIDALNTAEWAAELIALGQLVAGFAVLATVNRTAEGRSSWSIPFRGNTFRSGAATLGRGLLTCCGGCAPD
ncbi:MAG: DUF4011 domain-containing protein [Mycolicibacter sinensis]